MIKLKDDFKPMAVGGGCSNVKASEEDWGDLGGGSYCVGSEFTGA